MPLNFTNTNSAGVEQGIKSLVYGQSGAGKTTLCATAPYPLIISAESGLLSLRNQNIVVAEIKTMQDMNDIYAWCNTSNECRQNFQTINIDSISEIAEVLLATAKKVCKDPRQAYGEVIDKTLELVRSFRDLKGYNVNICAKMEPTKDEITGRVMFGPSLPGAKLGNKMPYYFDEVFYLGVGKDQQGNSFRFLQTQLDMQYVAKDRSGALDAYELPHLGHIYQKILGVTPQ